MVYVACGVPQEYCQASSKDTTHALGLHRKIHTDHDQAFKCMRNYLTKVRGYTQIGGREFYKEGEPVLVLTKRTHYGARMRTGGKDKGRRAIPRPRTGGQIVG